MQQFYYKCDIYYKLQQYTGGQMDIVVHIPYIIYIVYIQNVIPRYIHIIHR